MDAELGLALGVRGSRVCLAVVSMTAAASAAYEGGPAVPDVSSAAPAEVRMWVAIDQHKLSLVAGILPASGGSPEVVRVESTERAIGRLVEKLGGPEGLAVCYDAGPGGDDRYRLLSRLGVACDVIAPSWSRSARVTGSRPIVVTP